MCVDKKGLQQLKVMQDSAFLLGLKYGDVLLMVAL